MGSWGYESSANDDTWDELHAEDIHEMTQAEADNTLKKVDQKGRAFLGVVTHILFQGLIVDRKSLSKAAKIAKAMSAEDHPDTDRYDNLKKRIAALKFEVAGIELALESGGKIKPIEIKGLLSKIDGFMDGKDRDDDLPYSGLAGN